MNSSRSNPKPEPQSVAEGAVIGACLMDGSTHETVDALADIVTPFDFSNQKMGHAFASILRLVDMGAPVNPTSVAYAMTGGEWAPLKDLGEEEALTGMGQYIIDAHGDELGWLRFLGENSMSIQGAVQMAGKVSAYARMRRLKSIGERIAARAAAAEPDEADATIDDAINDILSVDAAAADYEVTNAYVATKAAMADVKQRRMNPGNFGVPTGLIDVDNLVSFELGDMYTIGADSGHGKTAFAVHIAYGFAASASVLYVTLEIPATAVALRLQAAGNRIDLGALRSGNLTATDVDDVGRYSTQNKARLERVRIVDASRATTAVIERELRKAKRKSPPEYPLKAVIVDYLGLVKPATRHKNRDQEVSDNCDEFKSMAKRHHVALIVLAQLNRDGAKRANKRPVVSDLRESARAEQYSSGVVFLYRPDKYGEECPDNICDIIVAKNRNGVTDTVRIHHIPSQNRFGDLTNRPDTNTRF